MQSDLVEPPFADGITIEAPGPRRSPRTEWSNPCLYEYWPQGGNLMLWLRCLLMGHDDTVAREPGRMWLRCVKCGRDTPGWRLGSVALAARSSATGDRREVDALAIPRCS